MNKNNVGTITFATATQLALFTNELDGQISDGMWENSGPKEHWVFWNRLDHAIGADVGVKTNESYRGWDRTGCRKNNYNFMSKELLSCVEDRMLKTGQLAQVLSTDDIESFKEKVHAADYMPETLEQYEQMLRAGSDAGPSYIVQAVSKLTHEEGRAFYASVYTQKDLHKDLRAIKKICKSMPVCR